MTAVLRDFLQAPLREFRLLDVGASTGIIDQHLAEHFGTVTGIDIDSSAVKFATNSNTKGNLFFKMGDALNLDFDDGSFEVVIITSGLRGRAFKGF